MDWITADGDILVEGNENEICEDNESTNEVSWDENK